MEENNKISLVGEVISSPKLSHETHNEKFYTVKVDVKRLSGDIDTLEIIISEKLYDIEKIKLGTRYYIEGEIRSYNYYVSESERRKLVINIFAKNLSIAEETDDECLNNFELVGHICKKPIYRKTPFDREISDILLAVNRLYGKSDYLPYIAWGRNAKFASTLEIGDKIKITGRMQSRQYTKKISDNEEEKKIAYEMSIITLEKKESEEE
ncbi:MAG: single-stranded DNA-binding protein [Clostridiales bacterium]|nr:single-stranded DNA-binding protein [Clostridiales bacterium]